MKNFGTASSANPAETFAPHLGICNSLRFGPHPKYASGAVEPPGIGKALIKDFNEKILHVSLPVIADFSPTAQPCQGLAGAVAEPNFVLNGADHDWRVIGFTRADIFDADVGNSPPPAPPIRKLTDATPDCKGDCDIPMDVYDVLGAPYNGNYQGFYWPFEKNPVYQPDIGWSFPNSCNVVRLRLACDTNFIPSEGGLQRLPRLID